MPFRERLIRFMMGRNGPDDLYRFLTFVCIALLIINIFVSSTIISVLILILLAINTWRCFSRELYKRRRENAAYLRMKKSLFAWFRLCRDRWRDRKTHIYRRCPHCKKVLRLPRRPGHHDVRCPLCSHKFKVKCPGKVKKAQ